MATLTYNIGILYRSEFRKMLEKAQDIGYLVDFHEDKNLFASIFTLNGSKENLEKIKQHTSMWNWEPIS